MKRKEKERGKRNQCVLGEQEELHYNSTTLCRLTKLDQKEFSSFYILLIYPSPFKGNKTKKNKRKKDEN